MAASLNSILALFVSSLFVVLPAPKEEKPVDQSWPQALTNEVEKIDQSFEGSIGVLVEDLKTQTKFSYNAGQRYYLASVIKLFIMAEIYRLVDENKLEWTDTVRIKSSKYRDGAGYVNWMQVNQKITIRKLLNFMMNKSDNAATDILLEIAGIPAVDDIARRYGVFDLGTITYMIDVRKLVWRQIHPLAGNLTALDYMELWKVRDFNKKFPLFARLINKPNQVFTFDQFANAFNKYYDLGYNSASLVAMLDFFKNINSGKVVSEQASKDMVKVLKACKTGKTRIKKGLPKDWEFGHKTGTQFRRVADMGIAYGPDGQMIAILMSITDFASRRAAEGIMAEITKKLFELKSKPIVPDTSDLLKDELPTIVY